MSNHTHHFDGPCDECRARVVRINELISMDRVGFGQTYRRACIAWEQVTGEPYGDDLREPAGPRRVGEPQDYPTWEPRREIRVRSWVYRAHGFEPPES